MTALEWVQRSKIIAIVRGLPKEYMTRLAEALYAGGIDLMEVTFHQQKPETWKDTAAAIAAVDSCMGRENAGRRRYGAHPGAARYGPGRGSQLYHYSQHQL